jgi:hypothetical protein
LAEELSGFADETRFALAGVPASGVLAASGSLLRVSAGSALSLAGSCLSVGIELLRDALEAVLAFRRVAVLGIHAALFSLKGLAVAGANLRLLATSQRHVAAGQTVEAEGQPRVDKVAGFSLISSVVGVV